MEGDLKEVVGNYLTVNSPPPPISEFIIYFLLKPMFSIFILAIKFDCLFWAIFQSVFCFVSCIFDKLVPPSLNICFKRCFKSLFSPFQCKSTLKST